VAACKWVRRVWRGSSEDSADIDPLMDLKNNVAFCLRMLHFSRSPSIMRLTKIWVVFYHEAVNFQESM
jgi:hypothetical protein